MGSEWPLPLRDILITTEAPLGNVAQVDREDVALAQRIIKYRRADFRICVPGGFWLSAECKAAGESLSLEQAKQATCLRNAGGRFVVVYSLGDLIEAIRHIEGG